MLKIFYLFLIPFGLEISVVENAQVQWGYIYRGYYMATRRYEISLRVLKNISRVSAANE